MVKICLTGGPSGGKSSSLVSIEKELTELGYKVFTISETATELITGGIIPSTFDVKTFQSFVFRLQKMKEKIYEEAASHFEKSVIICDRGHFDQMAYITKKDFAEMISKEGFDIADLIGDYDAVIHLVTAAKGTDAYTLENNKARTETPEEAIIADEKTMAAWVGHPHLRVIDNSTGFNLKVKRVIKEILNILGEPVPYEIERKYLVEMPDIAFLEKMDMCSKAEIVQTYLKSVKEDTERRIRQRGSKEAGYNFSFTEKTTASFGERIEIEKKITQREYIDYLSEADTTRHPIRKNRYCFLYENRYFELDVYSDNNKNAILEVELSDINEKISFPPFIKIIRDVTSETAFSNHEIAKR